MKPEDSDRSKMRTVRLLVYTVLVLSAVGAFFANDRLWAAAKVGDLPLWAPLAAPVAFTAFVGVYTVDRWLLVRRTRYPVMRAFFQVAFAVLFLTLLWPHNTNELREARAWGTHNDPAVRLLQSPNADVRALACEVLGRRRQAEAREDVAALTRDDEDEGVRQACAAALRRLSEPDDHGAAEPHAPPQP